MKRNELLHTDPDWSIYWRGSPSLKNLQLGILPRAGLKLVIISYYFSLMSSYKRSLGNSEVFRNITGINKKTSSTVLKDYRKPIYQFTKKTNLLTHPASSLSIFASLDTYVFHRVESNSLTEGSIAHNRVQYTLLM